MQGTFINVDLCVTCRLESWISWRSLCQIEMESSEVIFFSDLIKMYKIRQTRLSDYCVAGRSKRGRYILAMHDDLLITG